jgi:hypothetical protein
MKTKKGKKEKRNRQTDKGREKTSSKSKREGVRMRATYRETGGFVFYQRMAYGEINVLFRHLEKRRRRK